MEKEDNNLMLVKLNSHLESDQYFYFFSLLTDRFMSLNDIWAKNLEKRFGKKFKPIYVLPSKHGKKFEEENYIVLNKHLFDLQAKLHRPDLTELIYPEELNKQFSESAEIIELIKKLIKKQGQVFVLSFTNVWLEIDNPNVILLGPDPKVAARFDDKAEHIKTFKMLNLPINKTIIYPSFKELKKHPEYPFFLSATFSSGGFESKTIYEPEDLDVFYANLRPINQRGSFLAARLLEDIVLAPNTSAIVTGENQTILICTSDQILRVNRYMGNIYPSQALNKYKEFMEDATIKVGNYLSTQGFRGLFGIDFLITRNGDCYPTDLNPRRQGGYFCNVMMAQKKIDLIDLELRVCLQEEIPNFNFNDFQVNYAWAHSKLTPYFPNMQIIKDFEHGKPGDPFGQIGATYSAIYYPKNDILLSGNPGFYLATAKKIRGIKKKLIKDTETIISTSFDLYEGL